MDIATVHDIREIERILGHSTVYDLGSDDSAAGGNLAFEVAFWWLTTPGNIVLKGQDMAVFFQPRNYISYEMHIGVIADARRSAFGFAVQAVQWLMENTPCRKVVSMMPAYRREAVLFAKICGMKQEGISPKSFLKGGELQDCILLGATKEELFERYGGKTWHQS